MKKIIALCLLLSSSLCAGASKTAIEVTLENLKIVTAPSAIKLAVGCKPDIDKARWVIERSSSIHSITKSGIYQYKDEPFKFMFTVCNSIFETSPYLLLVWSDLSPFAVPYVVSAISANEILLRLQKKNPASILLEGAQADGSSIEAIVSIKTSQTN